MISPYEEWAEKSIEKWEQRAKLFRPSCLAVDKRVEQLEAIKAKAEKLVAIPFERIYWDDMMEAKNDLLEVLGKLRANP